MCVVYNKTVSLFYYQFIKQIIKLNCLTNRLAKIQIYRYMDIFVIRILKIIAIRTNPSGHNLSRFFLAVVAVRRLVSLLKKKNNCLTRRSSCIQTKPF